MQEDDRPIEGSVSGAGLDDESAMSRLEGIFASQPDLVEPRKKQVQENQGEPEATEVDEGEPTDESVDATEDGNAPEDAEAEKDTEETEAEEDGEAVEIDDSFEVDLGDGNRTSLADLKKAWIQGEERIKGFQREHTQKAMALADDRKAVETKAEEILGMAQELQAQRDIFTRTITAVMGEEPQPPAVSSEDDPFAWSQYMEHHTKWQQKMAQAGQVVQQAQTEHQKQAQKQQQEAVRWAQSEREALLGKRPELRNPETLKSINTEMVDVFKSAYGIEPHELQTLIDHRQVQVALDALAYRKLQAAKPQAKAKLQGKPKVLTSGKVMSSKEKLSRAKSDAADRLKKTGSEADAIKRLMDFDL